MYIMSYSFIKLGLVIEIFHKDFNVMKGNVQVMEQLQKVVEKILDKDIKSIAIVMHNKPDGDALGSGVALEEMLKNIGKKVDLIIHDKLSQKFAPIVGRHRVNKTFVPSFGKVYDLLIMVDFSDPSRTVRNIEKLSKFTIVLDHHRTNQSYGDLHYYENCSATGMIVYKIIEMIDKITPKIATAIYMAVVTDTNNFRNNNTNNETHDIASKLLSAGADIKLINSIIDGKSLGFIKLMGHTFRDIKYDHQYKITYLIVKRDKVKFSGATGEDVVRLIEEIRYINDSDITFLFIEGISNIRISARSKITPVDNILKHFGGGGHTYASGCAVDGANMNAVVRDVLEHTKFLIDSKK